MAHAPAIGSVVLFVAVVGMFVWAAVYDIDRCIPAEFHVPLKLLVGVLTLVAILYRLFPVM